MDRLSSKKCHLDIKVLGPSEITSGGRLLAREVFDKPYALLLYLAIERKRHHREDLIQLFWPGMDVATGRQNLSSTLYILKKRLGKSEVIGSDRISICWQWVAKETEPVDLLRFLDIRPPSGCDRLHEPPACSRCRDTISSRNAEYRGEFLADARLPALPEFVQWVESVRERAKAHSEHLINILSGTTSVFAPVSSPERNWEMRQVTIFCMQAHSAGEDDPEDLVRRFRKCLDIASSVSRKAGGWVVPSSGSMFISYFGFPVAQENATRQAVRAAIELLEKAGLSDEVLPSLKIGIHTAEVVCDLLRGDPDVLGKATRTASLVADESSPGEILVTAGTLELVRPFFWSEFHGELPQRKNQEQIAIHRILGESEGSSFSEAFVGRETELKRLLGLWRESVRGQVRVAWITGEQGIGKSRLVRSLVGSIGQSGVVRSLYCFPECAKTPWFPLIRIFRSLLGLDARKTKGEAKYIAEKYLLSLKRPVEEELPYFLGFLLGSANYPPMPPEKLSSLIENLLMDLLSTRMERSPVLLVVEDSCWADHATAGLLRKTLETISPGPLMVVFTGRSHESLKSIFPLPPDCEISLSELNPEESWQLAELLSRKTLSPKQIGAVVSSGSGIPLFIEEYVKIQSSGSKTLTLSSTIREVLDAHIDELGEAREMAQIAACLGLEFPSDLLEAVYWEESRRSSVSGVKPLISHLLEKGILKPSDNDPIASYIFRHAILRDAILLSISDPDRKLIHRRVVDVLKSRFPEIIEQEPECLAEHLTQGGVVDEAVDVWVLAAQRAISFGAFKDANAHLEKALEIARMDSSGSESSIHREIGILLAIGPVIRALHGYGSDRVEEVYREASDLCDRLGSSSRTFPVLFSLWTSAMTRFGPLEAMKWANEMLSVSRKRGLIEERIRASHAMGNTLSWTERLDEAERSLRDGLSEAAGFYDSDRRDVLSPYAEEPIVGLMCDLSRVLWYQGQSAQAEGWVERAIDRSDRFNHPISLCLSLSSSILLHFFSGETEKIEPVANRMGEVSQKHGFRLWDYSATFAIGWSQGNQEGLDMMRMARGVIEQDLPGYSPLYSLFEADAALRAKCPEESLTAIDQGRSCGARFGIRVLDPEFLRLEGEARLMIDPGRPELPGRLFREALAKALFFGAFGLARKAAFSLSRVFPEDRIEVERILERLPNAGEISEWNLRPPTPFLGL